jgi:hypothetical protein
MKNHIRNRTIFLSFLIILVCTRCEKIDLLSPKGETVEGILTSDSFSVVNIRGLFNIHLIEDSCSYVEYSCGKNLFDKISASATNDTIDLYNDNKYSLFYGYEKINIGIHYKKLKKIEVYESSSIYSTDSLRTSLCLAVRSELAEVNLTFSNYNFCFYNYTSTGGIYTFKGKTENFYFLGYYTAQFNMEELECKNAHVENHSVYDQIVFVTTKLNASTFFSGNIYYKGSPEVIIDSIVRTGGVFPYKE